MLRIPLILGTLGLVIVGCQQRPNFQTHLHTGRGLVTVRAQEGATAGPAQHPFPALQRMARQVTGTGPSETAAAGTHEGELPSPLAESSLIKKMVLAANADLTGRKVARGTEVGKTDVESFARALNETSALVSGSDNVAASAAAGRATRVARLMRVYLGLYVDGKFVDRTGAKLSKPEVKMAIGNDTITAVATVMLEAMWDEALKTPVYFKTVDGKEVYFTSTGAKPSAVDHWKMFADADIRRELKGNDGPISESDLALVRYTSAMAGEGSKLIAGYLYRLLGKIDIGFVIEGGFSFGDNETGARLLDTAFETASRRVTEAKLLLALEPRETAAGGASGAYVFELKQGAVQEIGSGVGSGQ